MNMNFLSTMDMTSKKFKKLFQKSLCFLTITIFSIVTVVFVFFVFKGSLWSQKFQWLVTVIRRNWEKNKDVGQERVLWIKCPCVWQHKGHLKANEQVEKKKQSCRCTQHALHHPTGWYLWFCRIPSLSSTRYLSEKDDWVTWKTSLLRD